MFISFPSQAVDFVARTIAPVTNKIMDKNFEEVSLFLRMMDEASQVRPDWIYEVSGQLDGVKKEDAGKLVELAEVDPRRPRPSDRGRSRRQLRPSGDRPSREPNRGPGPRPWWGVQRARVVFLALCPPEALSSRDVRRSACPNSDSVPHAPRQPAGDCKASGECSTPVAQRGRPLLTTVPHGSASGGKGDPLTPAAVARWV